MDLAGACLRHSLSLPQRTAPLPRTWTLSQTRLICGVSVRLTGLLISWPAFLRVISSPSVLSAGGGPSEYRSSGLIGVSLGCHQFEGAQVS